MRSLNRQQILLAIAVLAVVLYVAGYLVFARPLVREVSAYRKRVESKRASLNNSGWPLDYERLRKIADSTERDRAAAERHKNALLERTTSLFRERILRLYETPMHFQKQVSRLDFQEEFYRIEKKLADNGIKLDREVLGISEESVRPHTYRLVLQLWTLEAVADAIIAHDLRPLSAGRGAEGVSGGAALSLLPPVSYYLKPDDSEAYLLQFPVRIRVAGTIQDVYRFLASASAGNHFFAVTYLEVYKVLPDRARATDWVEVAVECGAFYIPDGRVRIEQAIPESPRILPAGA